MDTSARIELRAQNGGNAATTPGKWPCSGRATTHTGTAADAGSEEEASALRVAILDRDSGFLVVLANRLARIGWKHEIIPARLSAKALVSLQADALIVDIAILGAGRWKWLSRMCEQRRDLRVVVCTGSSTVAERVCALRLGADDWLSKPCHPEELIARVEAVTAHRRRPDVRDLEPVTVGEVEIRPDQYQAFVRGYSLRLTRREYQLIVLLSRGEGEVLPRQDIYECLWGADMIRNDRSVDVFVHKLRRKLEDASPGWRYIHTQFGIGYRLAAEQLEGALVHELQIPEEEPAVAPLAA